MFGKKSKQTADECLVEIDDTIEILNEFKSQIRNDNPSLASKKRNIENKVNALDEKCLVTKNIFEKITSSKYFDYEIAITDVQIRLSGLNDPKLKNFDRKHFV